MSASLRAAGPRAMARTKIAKSAPSPSRRTLADSTPWTVLIAHRPLSPPRSARLMPPALHTVFGKPVSPLRPLSMPAPTKRAVKLSVQVVGQRTPGPPTSCARTTWPALATAVPRSASARVESVASPPAPVVQAARVTSTPVRSDPRRTQTDTPAGRASALTARRASSCTSRLSRCTSVVSRRPATTPTSKPRSAFARHRCLPHAPAVHAEASGIVYCLSTPSRASALRARSLARLASRRQRAHRVQSHHNGADRAVGHRAGRPKRSRRR